MPTARLNATDTVGPTLRRRAKRAFRDPKESIPFASVGPVVDEGTEPVAFGKRPTPPASHGYRKRRAYSGQMGTLWSHEVPKTAGDTLRAIDGVLALRHSQTVEATLSGILSALALDAMCGEDVPAPHEEFPDSFELGQVETENRRLRATIAALTGDIAKARLALAQRLPDTAATLLLHAETAGGDALVDKAGGRF